jgi:ABC-type microcin C transport system permease subunit YejB
MFGGYNSIYYEVIASQTSTNCNRLAWRDIVNMKYFWDITVPVILRIFEENQNPVDMHTSIMCINILQKIKAVAPKL